MFGTVGIVLCTTRVTLTLTLLGAAFLAVVEEVGKLFLGHVSGEELGNLLLLLLGCFSRDIIFDNGGNNLGFLGDDEATLGCSVFNLYLIYGRGDTSMLVRCNDVCVCSFAIVKPTIELIYLTKTGPRSTLGSLAATAAVLASNVTAVRMNFIISFVLMIIGRLIIVKSK